MKQKKLLFVMPFFYGIGGVEKVIQQRLLFLQPFFQIKVIESNPNLIDDTRSKYPFEIIHIPTKGNKFLRFLSYIKESKKIIQTYQPDEITVLDNGWKGWFFPKFIKGTPINFELHVVLPKPNNNSLIYNFQKFLYQELLKKFDRVFFLNSVMANQWEHNQKTVIPNGIQLTMESFQPKENQCILWVGRESEEKGLENMLNIWSVLAPKYPEWTLKLFTPFKIQNELFYHLNQKIQMENIVGEFDFLKIYNQGAIYCNTSFSESFGMSILEAMHFGLAVISFDCDYGPRELIEPEVDGILVPRFDISEYICKLEYLINHPERRLELGKKTFEKSKQYQIIPIHKKWLEVYQSQSF
jgi:glycosyltransferase involved in cell wall biosynthesis